MRKSKHKKHSPMSGPLPGGHPGCMQAVLQVLKYQRWRNSVKMLPHKRHVSNKQATGDGNPGDNLQENSYVRVDNSTVEEKATQSTPGNTNSVKTRIRALFREEMYKRKARHKRSSSCPVPAANERRGPLDKDPLIESEGTIVTDNSDATTSMDPLLPKYFEEPITIEEFRTCNGFVDENEKQFIENDILFEENIDDDIKEALLETEFVNTKELTRYSSLCSSKEFVEALDIINLNKDFLLKVLHDPSSPLAHHFHNQQALSAKTRFTKSPTFPIPGSSGAKRAGLKKKNDVVGSCGKEEGRSQEQSYTERDSLEDICKQSTPSIAAEHREDGIRTLNQAMAGIADTPLDSTHRVRNPAAMKRFKDLKQKIKHAIKERKNETHRIAMDAVLHKIPHGQGSSTELKREILNQFKDSSKKSDDEENITNSHESDSFDKRRRHRMRRCSSFNETLDRYCKLYELSFKREDKQPISERSKSRTIKSLARILSSPELKCFGYQSDESCDAGMPVRTRLEEQKIIDIPMPSKSSMQLDSIVESPTQAGITSVAHNNLMQKDNVSEHVTAQLAEPSTVLEVNEGATEFSMPEGNITLPMDTCCDNADSEVKPGHIVLGEHESVKESPIMSDIEKAELLRQTLHNDLRQVLVDAQDKAKFDYVKNVLELSGFSGNESLGTWHSEDQPVDPSLFEEVEEDCIFHDPKCSGNGGGNCNHMLLFDLINEVLMEIYERSYNYYPTRLSYLSHIHPMPVGYHVLKEVWDNIRWYLRLRPEVNQSLEYVMSRDLARDDGWMHLQFDAECVGLEVEDSIFEDLLEEVIMI